MTIGVVLVALLAAGIVIYHRRAETREAKAKAARLIREFERAGLPTPADPSSVAGVLGTDGGAVCEEPTNELTQAMLNLSLSNGAATVGIRPVIVSSITLRGEALILSVYCPEELPAFREYVDENEFDEVVGR